MTRQDLIDLTTFYLLNFSGLSEVEIQELNIERLRYQDHKETIKWCLDGGAKPVFLLSSVESRRSKQVEGWRHGTIDEDIISIIGPRALPQLPPKSEFQIRRETEIRIAREQESRRLSGSR